MFVLSVFGFFVDIFAVYLLFVLSMIICIMLLFMLLGYALAYVVSNIIFFVGLMPFFVYFLIECVFFVHCLFCLEF